MKDPYEILGVKPSSTTEEIKAAYKKLARKYHPDLNPGNKESESKFKEVAHAFDQIGTPESKGKFDRAETEEQKEQQYEDFAKEQSRKRGPYYHETQQGQSRYSTQFESGFEDEIFSNLFGKGRKGRSDDSINIPGEDELYQLEVDFHEAALGIEKVLTLSNGKKLQVQIPAGIQSGQKLKFKGQGRAGIGSGSAGDAYIQIAVRASDQFKREGKDIISEVPISFFEAMNGAQVEVMTIDGKVMLNIPAGVSTGTKVRVKGKGIGKGDNRGHHLAIIKVVMPKDPPLELKELIHQLQKKFDYNPRTHA